MMTSAGLPLRGTRGREVGVKKGTEEFIYQHRGPFLA